MFDTLPFLLWMMVFYLFDAKGDLNLTSLILLNEQVLVNAGVCAELPAPLRTLLCTFLQTANYGSRKSCGALICGRQGS